MDNHLVVSSDTCTLEYYGYYLDILDTCKLDIMDTPFFDTLIVGYHRYYFILDTMNTRIFYYPDIG